MLYINAKKSAGLLEGSPKQLKSAARRLTKQINALIEAHPCEAVDIRITAVPVSLTKWELIPSAIIGSNGPMALKKVIKKGVARWVDAYNSLKPTRS